MNKCFECGLDKYDCRCPTMQWQQESDLEISNMIIDICICNTTGEQPHTLECYLYQKSIKK